MKRARLLRFLLPLLVGGFLAGSPAARAYELENVRWPNSTQITLNLLLAEPGRTLLDGTTSWNQVAADAANVWNPYLGSGVQFRLNYDYQTAGHGDGVDSVFFSDTIYGESFGGDTLAVTLLNYSGATLTETDVVVNGAKKFDSYRGDQRRTAANLPLYDLRRILIHEFGHVLGLDHAPSSLAIMYAYVSNVDTVQSDDIAGVTAIYGEAVHPPVITGPTTAFAKANEPFTYKVVATGGKLTYAASGLPAGLQLAPGSSSITGTPSTPGVFTVYLTAANSVGSATAILTLTVGTPPVITSPTNVTALLGLPFYYQITATGNPTAYGPYPGDLDVSYNRSRGVLSGTPKYLTTYYGTISASNAGGTGSAPLSVIVGHDLAATVLSQPGGPNNSLFNAVLTPGADNNFYAVSRNGILRVAPNGAGTLLGAAPTQEFPYSMTVNPDLVVGTDGNLYGTFSGFSTDYPGAIFRITQGGVASVVYRFTAADAGTPQSTPVLGADGNFYGTLQQNGASTSDAVYRLTPGGVMTILHRFNSDNEGSLVSGLVQGPDGNFYGTATIDSLAGSGAVFRVTPAGDVTTLPAATVGIFYPAGRLIVGPDGNLYGKTSGWFLYGENTINPSVSTFFRVKPGGSITKVHSLGMPTEGQYPDVFKLGPDGFLYGVGLKNYPNTGQESVFARYALDGTYTVLHHFTISESMLGAPTAGVGADGSLYYLTATGDFGRITPGLNQEGSTFVSVQPQLTTAIAANAQLAKVTLSRGGGDASRDLALHLTYDGTARPGFDYEVPSDPVVIPAGSASTLLAINALPQARNSSLNVHVAAGEGYVVNPNADVVALRITGARVAFFADEAALSSGVYYLKLPNGNVFGYYAYLDDPRYVYHFDLGYEYVFDADDGRSGVYLYDFASQTFFYTSPTFPFPYLYDFTLNTVLYYYPDPNNASHYNTNGVRYFYNFATGQIISK